MYIVLRVIIHCLKLFHPFSFLMKPYKNLLQCIVLPLQLSHFLEIKLLAVFELTNAIVTFLIYMAAQNLHSNVNNERQSCLRAHAITTYLYYHFCLGTSKLPSMTYILLS